MHHPSSQETGAERPASILILTHLVPEVTSPTLREVLAEIATGCVRLALPKSEVEKHARALREARLEWEEWPDGEVAARARSVDLCLVLGGDGTTLRALHATRGAVPLVGVNLGRVGFLSTVRADHLHEDLGRVLAGETRTHLLPALEITGTGDVRSGEAAFNDIVFGRSPGQSICRLGYSVSGVPLFDLRCDGLVVSTPVGSSAYNLSCGGPLLGLGVDGYVVTYLAPHALEARSLVAPSSDPLVVTNTSAREGAAVILDGVERGMLSPGMSACVRMKREGGLLALLPQDGLYRNLRERFL